MHIMIYLVSIKSYNIFSEIDNDAYCVCTHDFSLCTHRKFRPVRTMYAVKISGTQTVFGFMHTQIKKKIPLKLSQNDNFSTSFVWLLCQQWKSSYNINVAFAGSILTYHAIYIVCIFTCSPFSSSARQVVYQRFIHEV